MKTKQKATKLLALVITTICALFANYAINQQNTSAISASYDNAIIQKAMLTGMIGCYENGVFTSPTKELSEIWGIANIIDLNNNIKVALPSGLTGDKTNVTDCDILLNGVPDGYIYGNARQVLGDLTGIFEGSGHSDYSGDIDDPEQKVSFLENMAYQQMDAKKECVYYTFLADGDRAYTENICYKNNSLYVESSGGDRGTGAIFSPHNDVFLTVELNGKTYEDIASTVRGWDVFKRELETFISNTVVREWGNGYRYEGMVENTHGDSRYAFPSVVSGAPQYTRYEKAIRTFSTKGYKSYPDLKFTDEEKLTYYVEALKNWLFKDQKVADYQRCDISDPATNTKYKMIKIDLSNNSPSDTCGVDPDIAVNDYIFGFTSDGYFDYTGNTKLTLSDVIYEINQLVDAGAIPGTVTGESDDPCLSSGAAGNMGWLVCNILKVAQEATTGIYNDAVEPLLQVKPELFASNSSTREAWSIFQGFANILFVIFFLFVIFSQLTGIGIDNYGIKKILPKMIVAAVLINLSYLLCQIAIDLSNILGNGIQSMFDNMDLAVSAPGIGGVNVGTEISVFLASALTVGIVTKAVILNPAILLGLFVGVLGVLIAIFFVFILLSMRQAALVILTVISPVAFVLYMLPNTKKLFDKWLKAGKGLLLLYPICALLISGGDFVSRLLLSVGYAADNIWGSLVAMVVGIVPIFFIPTVLKSSFAALGGIGATVSNFGNRLRGGATTGIKKSEGYKNLQAIGQRRRLRIKAGRDKEGNLTSIGRAKAHIAQSGVGKILYGKTFAGYSEAAEKYRQEDIQAASTIDSSLVQSELAEHPELTPRSIYDQRLGDAIKNKKSTSDIFAIIDAAKSAGVKPKDIAAMTRKHLGGNSIPGMSTGDRANFLRQFANRYGNDFLKKDYEQKSWAMSGGMGYSTLAQKMADANGTNQTAESLTGYADVNIDIDDMKDEDVAALSTENLAELIRKRKISSQQAQRVWASNSNMDDTNRLMLGAYGSDSHIELTKDEAKDAVAGKSYSKGLTKDMVTAFTRRAAEAVVLEDVKKRNVQDGSNRQSDPLETTNSSSPYEWGGGTGSGGGS